jgi:hypothetical protein
MRRITLFSLALLTVMLVPVMAAATPQVNGANIAERIFNDCPFTNLTVVNDYPSLISIEDAGLVCNGGANLTIWSLSSDGGATAARFDNDSDFRISADVTFSGQGRMEGGLRISPWWSQSVDGAFNVKSGFGGGEIAVFGGRLPFFSFTGAYGLHYETGKTISLSMTYKPHGLNASGPATIEYEVTYEGSTYSSGTLLFDQANPAEDPPHGLWGMLNDGRVGGRAQSFMDGNEVSAKATFTNIRYVICPVEPDPDHATTSIRIFNDCPFSSVNVSNNYPSNISISDGPTACDGFANLHTWTLSDDGNVEHRFQNDDDFSIACDFSLSGPGEGGLRISPWWSQQVDGLFNVRATDGEVAVFGGRLPFFRFTSAPNNLVYAGGPIHLEMIYKHNGLSQASPATIVYNVDYQGNHYSSGVLSFDQANPNEDPPNGLWGILNNARVGGHMKAFQFLPDKEATVVGNWSNIVYKAGADVSAKITPSSFNPNSNGNFVTAVLEPAAPNTAAQIDVNTLRLNGQAIPVSTTLGDANHNGVQDLTVVFDRAASNDAIGSAGAAIVTGEVNGVCFAAGDQVKVVKVKKPAGGSSVTTGSTAEVTWDTPEGVQSSTADIYLSLDGGQSWSNVIRGAANNGRYNWQVGSTLSSNARIAVQLGDNSGISGAFSISSPVGVGDDAISFALRGVSPNPSKGPFGINFSLPDGKKATLSVFDVSGRRVAAREVGSLGAGRHNVTLGKSLKAGVYMIRLDREGASLTTRAAVIQ